MTAADCLYRSAAERLDAGDFSAARELARAGLRLDRDHAGLLQVLGLAAYHLNDPHAARDVLEAASVIAPLSAVSRLALGDLFIGFGRRGLAATVLLFLAEPGRCPTPLPPDLARLLGKLGAYRAAYKVCRRLTELRPWYHPAHYGMAHYLAKLGRPAAKVIRHLRAAVARSPRAVPYRVALAGALAVAGRPGEACEVVRDVPADAVDCAECLERLLRAAEAATDVELAARFRARLQDVLRRRREPGDDCFGTRNH